MSSDIEPDYESDVQSDVELNIKSDHLKREKKIAWDDPDDKNFKIDLSSKARLKKLRKNESETLVDGFEYQKRLQDYYKKTNAGNDFTKWASHKSNKFSNESKIAGKGKKKQQDFKALFDDVELSSLKKSRSDNILAIKKHSNLFYKDRLNCVVQTLDFNPKNPNIFLAAGLDKTLRFYKIQDENNDNTINEIFQEKNILFQNFPILKAKYIETSRMEVLISGQKKNLYALDIETMKHEKLSSYFFTKNMKKKIVSDFAVSPDGTTIAFPLDTGHIEIMWAKNKQVAFDFKMNEKCTGLVFDPSSRYLYTTSDNGYIYTWDLNTRKILHKMKDYGSIKTTCVDCSDRGVLGTGNEIGFVNLYQTEYGKILSESPFKKFDNLTVAVTGIKFTEDSDDVIFYSKWGQSQLKVGNIETLQIYSNWPNFRTKLGLISQCALGRRKEKNSILIGNDTGNITLYEYD